MPDSKLTPSSYKKLVANIVSLFDGVRSSLVGAGWKTGQWIVEVEQEGDVRATRGDQLLSKLSEDLTQRLGSGFSVQSLRRMRQFYLDNPKRSPASVITWAHHIELLPIRDKKIRLALERRAEREELDRDSLRALVRHERVREQVAENLAALERTSKSSRAVIGASATMAAVQGGRPGTREPPELLPAPKLGLLNTYQIKGSGDTAWPDKNVLLLDHGFKSYHALTFAERRGLKAGDVVEWTGTKLLKSGRTAKDLFTYKAYLEKVIDADTYWVMLDTGMRGIGRQKLRLHGIDCPEIHTKEGQAAKKFVEDLLRSVPYLIVLSHKNDKYDRYEADVFLPGFFKHGSEASRCTNPSLGNLTYLNNLLLETGWAVREYR